MFICYILESLFCINSACINRFGEQQWIRKANVGRIGFGRKRLAKALVALIVRFHRGWHATALEKPIESR